MARATLEMFLKLIGVDKASRELKGFTTDIKNVDNSVKNSSKANAQFAAGMSGLGKTAIAGGAIFAAKSLADFSLEAIKAASSAQEAAGAFGTTFGGAAEQLNKQLAENANLFGLTTAEAQQLISVFGSVAQGIGFTQEESADLSSDLFNLAGDIASFNNITAGAAPVLQAFRSALVGEREALKTYGIAITEAEVQTKAFQQTGKTSADELTRQEKALATTALIFERSAVQQGNAAREAAGFAAQTLIARSATQELREELGEELLPAAGEVLRVFNEIRSESTPQLIDRFSELNLQVLGAVNLFEQLRDVLSLGGNESDEFVDKQKFVANGLSRVGAVLKALGLVQKVNIQQDKAQIESTQQLVNQFENYSKNQQIVNDQLKGYRRISNILIPLNKKFGKSIDKDVLPFAEKLVNILGLSNKQIKILTDLQEDRDDAQKDLNKALEEEGLITAQEALRKKELQQQIAELTFFQKQGKDVTEELAVAQEELKLIELALTRDSDQLIEARKRAAEAQEALDEATNKGTSAMETQLNAAQNLQEILNLFNSDNFQTEIQEAADLLNIQWKDALDLALQEYLKFKQQVSGQTIVDLVNEQLAGLNLVGLGAEDPSYENEQERKEVEKVLEQQRKEREARERERKTIVSGGGGAGKSFFSPVSGSGAVTPSGVKFLDTEASDRLAFIQRGQAGNRVEGTIDINLTDALGDIIQKEVVKIQERGNTLVIE